MDIKDSGQAIKSTSMSIMYITRRYSTVHPSVKLSQAGR